MFIILVEYIVRVYRDQLLYFILILKSFMLVIYSTNCERGLFQGVHSNNKILQDQYFDRKIITPQLNVYTCNEGVGVKSMTGLLMFPLNATGNNIHINL